MKILEYDRNKAHQSLNQWKKRKDSIGLSSDYAIIRTNLIQLYEMAKNEVNDLERKGYLTDVFFGLKLYEYLKKTDWFNMRTAANDDFWRYISVATIPDIVANRWGENNDNYFWKQSNRLWPKTIWWYIYLCWYDSIDKTKEILISKNFNSDTIQGIVERTGKKGAYVEVYREIVLQYSKLDYNVLVKYKKRTSNSNDSLFRAIMRLNTARILVIDPNLCVGGVKDYVHSIINDITYKL